MILFVAILRLLNKKKYTSVLKKNFIDKEKKFKTITIFHCYLK